MNKKEIINGIKYEFVMSTKQFRDNDTKLVIETMAPIVVEMDKNYLRLRALMDKKD